MSRALGSLGLELAKIFPEPDSLGLALTKIFFDQTHSDSNSPKYYLPGLILTHDSIWVQVRPGESTGE